MVFGSAYHRLLFCSTVFFSMSKVSSEEQMGFAGVYHF